MLDADGNEIIEYQGGDINAVIYIESAGEAYGQFITTQEITDQQVDNAQEAANVSNEDNNDNYNYTEDVDTSPYSHSGCNALSFNSLPLLLITLALFKRKKL